LELTSFQLDRVNLRAELFDANGTSLVYASSMTTVNVVGTDSVDGIEKITLLKPDQTTSTQTFFGVVQTATATFSSLADGQYTAKVYHLAETQTAEGSFNRKSRPKPEGGRAPLIFQRAWFARLKSGEPEEGAGLPRRT